ncbi:coiled-coil domain-containing protein 148-like [Centruroides sculpturatus]|uniref:coiled-coil domain-containing protein 148-like n=1 Tax=Centruroides sculpturatus TaxID=218467 RepID=UPI000C6CDF75|nr:coiled-coil domain-containing protein 148-like [Centruroides sculpturatus]
MKSHLKPINIDKLQASVAEKKASTSHILDRANQLKTLSRSRKEESLLAQHKVIWEQEYMHLRYLEEKFQREVYNHLATFGRLCDEDDLYLADGLNYVLELEEEKALFKENVVNPLWYLREDLQEWLNLHADYKPLPEDIRLYHNEVQEQVKSVWEKYIEIVYSLEQELIDLEVEVKEARSEVIGDKEKQIPKGIPDEFQKLLIPDIHLKDTLLSELHRIDDTYKHRLKELEAVAAKHSKPGGWNEKDLSIFKHILQQYPTDLTDRRVLLFNRLKRTFPNKSLAQLMAFETWLQTHKFQKDRYNKCLDDWTRERWSWLLRAVSAISQAQQSYEVHEMTREEIMQQKALCQQLRQKVEQWRKEKEIEKRQQAEIESQRKMVLQAAQQSQAAIEERRRTMARQRLRDYYEEKLRFQQESEEALSQRLDEMRQLTKERSKYDRERVDAFGSRLPNFIYGNIILVRVRAERDPDRLEQDTVSSQAKRELLDWQLQTTLFNLHTYTDDQVLSSPRIRLEYELREAGLIRSDYARQILQIVKPSQEPRRDTVSSVFQYEQLVDD